MSKPEGKLIKKLELQGLQIAPPQVWGGVRLVPLLRPDVRDDLRLAKREYDEDLTIVAVDAPPLDAGVKYLSYVPHALVVSWSDDGAPAVAFGTHVFKPDGKRVSGGSFSARILHRMVKREDRRRLRLLPLHLAMEGFLALYFNGPEIAWSEYSKQALRTGLSPRSEMSVSGWGVPGLQDALRLFEIHDNQVGVLIFVEDALGSAFVVSHPDDYRALHQTVLEDFYGELIRYYGTLTPTGELSKLFLDDTGVTTLSDLRRAHDQMRDHWASYVDLMAGGILGREVASTAHYKAGPFLLQRFMTDLDKNKENHFGEAMVRDDGTLEYLKTYRLSAAQTRRAFLLKQLAGNNWNLDAAAASMNTPLDDLIVRIVKAGFGYLLNPEIVRASRLGPRK